MKNNPENDILLKKTIFFIITVLSIGPLLIEEQWLIKAALLTYVVGLVWLSLLPGSGPLDGPRKWWFWIVVAYVAVFILSFLLRPPYVEDGIWRLSAPGMMLLVLWWFYVAAKHQLGWLSVKALAIGVIFWGIVVLVSEQYLYHPDLLAYSYKAGQYLSGIGHMGTIIPIGAGLALLVAVRERKSWIWWLVAIAALLLVLLLKKRTPLVIYSVMLFVWIGWLLLGAHWFTRVQKMLLIAVGVAVVGVGGYLQRDTIKAAYSDYEAARHGNYTTSLGLRYLMLDMGARLITEKPVTGWGPNAYKREGLWPLVDRSPLDPKSKPLIKGFTHLHNQYVMDWVLSGIAGLISGLLLIFYPAWIALKGCARMKWGENVLGAGLVFGIAVAMLFGALFTYTYTTMMILLAFSGLVLVFSNCDEARARA